MNEYEKLTVDELINRLRKYISDEDTMKAFKDQCINGFAFMELDKEDLQQMKIKIGPQKIILKLIRKAKEKNESCNDYLVAQSVSSHEMEPNHLSVVNMRENSPHEIEWLFSRYGSVTKTLEQHAQGTQMLHALKAKIIDEKCRRALIRIVVTELTEFYGSFYPPEEAKDALAKAIVSEFPRLRNLYSENGWEHYYDKKSKRGFIEYRLYTIRKTVNTSRKRQLVTYEPTASTSRTQPIVQSTSTEIGIYKFDEDDIQEKILLLKCTNPTEENRDIIESCLADTRDHRRLWIKSTNPPISEIFNMYPRLLDYNGDMIEQEFKHWFPQTADSFMNKFSSFYTKRILRYAKKCKPNSFFQTASTIKDENFRALLLLAELLPISNGCRSGERKGKKRLLDDDDDEDEEEEEEEGPRPIKNNLSNEFLLKIIPEGSQVLDVVQEVQNKYRSLKDIQPFITILPKLDDEYTIFIQGDSWLIEVNPKKPPISAFDLLYKCYYVLNRNYPKILENFYNFMDVFIYKINNISPKNMVASLHVNIETAIIDNR